MPGQRVGGRYEVQRLLGRGGVGLVYEARDVESGEAVALKVLRPEAATRPDLAARFRSELTLAGRVAHPNVCRLFAYGEDGSLRYLAMERVEGRSLREVLVERGRLAWSEACSLALQAARGLSAVHAAAVLHRDLKTANLMLDTAGRVRVMDFGIAKALGGEGVDLTATGYSLGSPEYMSPEQARGRRLDPRSDLYSLGIVLYELLTGRVPFRGETPVATLLLHLEAPPPLASTDMPGVPESLRVLLRRLLAKDPDERPASADEVVRELGVISGDSADGATPRMPGSARRGRPLARVALAAGGMALLLVSALVWRAAVVRPGGGSTAQVTPSPLAAPSLEAPTVGRASPSVEEITATTTPGTPSEGAARPSVPPARPAPTPMPTEPPSPAATGAPSEATAVPSPAGSSATGRVPESGTSPPTAETPPAVGHLLVTVVPWADVTVDGRVVGQTPLARVPLTPGPHSVVLAHPDYHPYPRKVTIRAGETFHLAVDLSVDGVRKATP
jgi:serine/threonine-protein kinase